MVVSSNLANIQQTKVILQAHHLRSMLTNSVFINTDSRAPVVENQLIKSMYENTEITEFLDVSETKPPSVDSEFYRLPNVILSRHIAGSIHDEVTK